MLTKKLAHPYDLPKSLEDYDNKLFKNINEDDFFSVLKDSKPSNEDINRTFYFIEKYNLKTFGDLTDLYLKSDIDLLTDVFENFIEFSLKEFGINPLYCYSLRGFTWLWGLNFTDVELHYLKDDTLIRLVENDVRGGVSSVMGDRYVESNDEQKVLNNDAYNLYVWAMSEYLPFVKIKFEEEYNINEILNTADDADVGYFVECDLEYSKKIKEITKYFPLAPVNSCWRWRFKWTSAINL